MGIYHMGKMQFEAKVKEWEDKVVMLKRKKKLVKKINSKQKKPRENR
jgi:hypothetical protein